MRRRGDPLVVDYARRNDEEIAGSDFVALFADRIDGRALQHKVHLVHCGMTVQFGFNDVWEDGDSDLGDVWQNSSAGQYILRVAVPGWFCNALI